MYIIAIMYIIILFVNRVELELSIRKECFYILLCIEIKCHQILGIDYKDTKHSLMIIIVL